MVKHGAMMGTMNENKEEEETSSRVVRLRTADKDKDEKKVKRSMDKQTGIARDCEF